MQETIKVVSDVGSDADVVLISALSDDKSDVCLVSGKRCVSLKTRISLEKAIVGKKKMALATR